MKRKQHVFTAFVLVPVILLLTACGAGTTPVQHEDPVELGERYLSELDFDNAILSFGEALEIDPKDEQALQGMGDAYRERGNETVRRGEEGSAEAARADYEQARSYYAEIPESSQNAAEAQEEIARLDTLIALESGEKPAAWEEAYQWELVKLVEWGDYDEVLLRKGEYGLIYLNDDDIPELFMWFPETDGKPKHFVLLVYDPEKEQVKSIRFPGEEDNIPVGFGFEERSGFFYVEYAPTDPARGETGELLATIWGINEDNWPAELTVSNVTIAAYQEWAPSSAEESIPNLAATREEYEDLRNSFINRSNATTFYEHQQGSMKTIPYYGLLEALRNFEAYNIAAAAVEAQNYHNKYLKVIEELEEEYGELRVDPYRYLRYQEENTEVAGGLLLTLLEDMTGDGVPELFTVTSTAGEGLFWGNIYTIDGTEAVPLTSYRHEGFSVTEYYVNPDRELIRLLRTKDHGIVFPYENQDKENYMLAYYGVKDQTYQDLFYYSRERRDGGEQQLYIDGKEVDLGDEEVDASTLAAEWLGEYEEETYCVLGPAGSVEEERLREQVEKVKEELAAAP